MGRPRKPTNVLQLTGRLKNNRNRRNENEPVPQGPCPTEPPAWMKDKLQRACYRELIRNAPANVLSVGDECGWKS